MRKIFTFLCAALMSASMFADPNILTPTISGDLSFTESTTVTMECASPNSDIYYTTDGVTDPKCDCSAAPEYTHPITITETTVIKAAAFDGNDWSAVAEVTFTKVPAPAAKYYIVGNMTNWEVNDAYEMSFNEFAETEEYSFWMHLTTANQFKVVKVEGENRTWYPDGMGNNYGEHGEITSEANYNIYFRPNADGDEAWFYNLILVEKRIVIEPVVFSVKVPENGKPESIEISGDFGEGWENGVVLEPNGGWYMTDALFADEYDEFKIRGAGSWDNEIYVRTETGWTASQNFRFGALWTEGTRDEAPIKVIELDLSGENYGWKQSVQSIDNIELTEQAQKVVVDGVIYIVRDGKLFNAQGAQVR